MLKICRGRYPGSVHFSITYYQIADEGCPLCEKIKQLAETESELMSERAKRIVDKK